MSMLILAIDQSTAVLCWPSGYSHARADYANGSAIKTHDRQRAAVVHNVNASGGRNLFWFYLPTLGYFK